MLATDRITMFSVYRSFLGGQPKGSRVPPLARAFAAHHVAGW